MTQEDEKFIELRLDKDKLAEFEAWFDQLSVDRILVAYRRAVRQFDNEFSPLNDEALDYLNEDYLNDDDFITIFSLVFTDLWTQDTMRDLQQEGSVILDVQADGNLRAYVS